MNVCATGGETGEREREREDVGERARNGWLDRKGERERERTLRIGVGEEARGGTGREIAWKRDGGRGTRERERERKTGRGMIAHAAQMCLKHRAALAMPSPNLYPPPPHPFRGPSLPPLRSRFLSFRFAPPPPLRLVIRANLIARRHRWPLTGIELSAVSVPGTWTAGCRARTARKR